MAKNNNPKTSSKSGPLIYLKRHENFFFPLLLLALVLACYAIWARQMGFYWDEWAFVWISRKLGDAGLAQYFSTNRPFWGLIYRLTLPLIGYEPWRWQFFSMFWRWLCAVLVWALLKMIWPQRKEVAASAAILFLVYPGFDLQPISLMFGHFFVVLAAFLASLFLMVLARRRSGWVFYLLIFFSMVTSLINLLAMEYFIVLDLLRLPILWIIEGKKAENWVKRLKRTVFAWLPYASVLAVIGIWRAFFFKFQTTNYQPVLLNKIKSEPFATLLNLFTTVISDLYKVSIEAWSKMFIPPAADSLGKSGLLVLALLVGLAVLLTITWFYWLQAKEDYRQTTSFEMLGVALAALLLGGVPFWLTGLPVGLVYQTSRFTLPFLFGVCLLVSAVLWFIPGPRSLRIGLLAVIVACSVSYQIQVENDYRRDWAQQTALFWQLSWRAPAIQPGTALVINDYPMTHVSDNSLSAPLNEIFAPDNHSQNMSYMLYFASLRGDKYFNSFTSGQTFDHNYLAAVFHGSSDQMLAVDYDPPACLAVLDPDIDPSNALLPVEMRSAARLSAQTNILSQPDNSPSASIFGNDPQHGWCYYFEKASLARQMGKWDLVSSLGDKAFTIKDYPNGPLERLPFIEGYAHMGRWNDALKLSQDTAKISPVTHAPLCSLWARIDSQVPFSKEKEQAQSDLARFLPCNQS